MYKIIGIAGPARRGKDTAANHIIHLRPAWEKASFADPIKAMLRVGLGLTDAQLHGNLKETYDPFYKRSPRHMMQTLGTEWGRELIGKNIWVNAMDKHLDSLGGTFLIPDVRFDSEADFVREHGTLIHIIGREHIIDSDHVSENPVTIHNSDILLNNNRSLVEYLTNIELRLHELEQLWNT